MRIVSCPVLTSISRCDLLKIHKSNLPNVRYGILLYVILHLYYILCYVIHANGEAGRQAGIQARMGQLVHASCNFRCQRDRHDACSSVVSGWCCVDWRNIMDVSKQLIVPHVQGLSSHELLGPAIFYEIPVTIHSNTRVSEDLPLHLNLCRKVTSRVRVYLLIHYMYPVFASNILSSKSTNPTSTNVKFHYYFHL